MCFSSCLVFKSCVIYFKYSFGHSFNKLFNCWVWIMLILHATVDWLWKFIYSSYFFFARSLFSLYLISLQLLLLIPFTHSFSLSISHSHSFSLNHLIHYHLNIIIEKQFVLVIAPIFLFVKYLYTIYDSFYLY